MAYIDARRYYFESAFSPAVIWVDMDRLELQPGSDTLRLSLSEHPILSGEVSDAFTPAEPFRFLGDKEGT